MGATAFQRMRREQEALEAVEQEQDALEGQEIVDALNKEDETALRAKAKELGIKSWHVKSIETLEKEIADSEKGGV